MNITSRIKKTCFSYFAVAAVMATAGCSGYNNTNTIKVDENVPHHVLCIGNSITRHTPYDAVNWYSDQGMAASKPEKDYCHVLQSLMRQQNQETTVTPVNIADWERDFSTDLSIKLSAYCKGKDIIVIRLGENVPAENEGGFSAALSGLIEFCKQYTDKIIITGEYWPSQKKEQAVKDNADKYGLPYVNIDWIWNEHREECSPKEGDTIYDTDGNPYQIVGNFILTHPNDKGMEYIAKAIYEKIF